MMAALRQALQSKVLIFSKFQWASINSLTCLSEQRVGGLNPSAPSIYCEHSGSQIKWAIGEAIFVAARPVFGLRTQRFFLSLRAGPTSGANAASAMLSFPA